MEVKVKNNFVLSLMLALTSTCFYAMDDVLAGRRSGEPPVASEHETIEQMGDRHEEELRNLQRQRFQARGQVTRDAVERKQAVRNQVRTGELTGDEGSLQIEGINRDVQAKKEVINFTYDNAERSMRAGHARELAVQDPVERSIHEKYLRDKAEAESDYRDKDKKVDDDWQARDSEITEKSDLAPAERERMFEQNDASAQSRYDDHESEHKAKMKSLRDGYESDLAEARAKKTATEQMDTGFQDALSGEVAKPEKSFDDMDYADKKAYIKKNLPESVTDALSPEELDSFLDFAADTSVDEQLVRSDSLTPEQATKLKGQIKEAMKKAEQSVFKDPRLKDVLEKPEVKEMFKQQKPASEQVQRVIKEAESEYWNENASRLDKITKWAKDHKLLIAGLVTFVVLAIFGAASN